jgi:biopolymer transport protein ExbD
MARAPFKRRRSETTLALINIVFLMLVFFLVAGRIAPPVPQDLILVQIDDPAPAAPADTLAVTSAGQVFWKGLPARPEDYAAALQPAGPGGARVARLMVDRDLPAAELVALSRRLREAGAQEVRLVAERRTE